MKHHNTVRRRATPPADWTPPARTIVVIGSQRSGSTLLCALMAQTDRLGKPDEFFKEQPFDHWPTNEDDTPARRARLMREEGTSSNDVCGVKIFSYHFERVQQDIELFAWFPNPFFVWIRRRDMLGQAISASIAKQTGKYRSFYEDRGFAVEYDARDVTQRLQRAALDDACWRYYLARTGAPCLEIFYEDMVAAPDVAIRALGAAVGVDLDGVELSMDRVGMAVQRSEINEAWSARFRAEHGDLNTVNERLDGAVDMKTRRKPKKPKKLNRLLRAIGLR
jgi:LPS sulfotransferase NodH